MRKYPKCVVGFPGRVASLSPRNYLDHIIGAIAGSAGLGGAFTGTIRSLVPLVEARERAGLFSAICLVSYITFGVPVIAAGLFLNTTGVRVSRWRMARGPAGWRLGLREKPLIDRQMRGCRALPGI
jgi:hypothetical protein